MILVISTIFSQASQKLKAEILVRPRIEECPRAYLSGKHLVAFLRNGAMFYVLVGVVLSNGCGKQGLETTEVTGTVRVDGKAYTQGGSIVFQPEGKGKQASGEIRSDGSFMLSTYTPGDGAIVGKHKVLVMPPPVADIGDDQVPSRPPASPLYEAMAKTPAADLVVEVKSGKANQLDIDLKTR